MKRGHKAAALVVLILAVAGIVAGYSYSRPKGTAEPAAEKSAGSEGATLQAEEAPQTADAISVRIFPAKSTTYEIDPSDQFGTYYQGMWQGSVADDNGERSYKIYVPQNCRRDASAYYIAVPDGVDSCEFLSTSGWIDLAENDKVVLCIFEPAGQKWGNAKEEQAYFDNAYAEFSGTAYVYHDIFNWRWIGYGAGGEMMQRYIMNNPMVVAGAVIVDGSENISAAELGEIGGKHFVGPVGNQYSVTFGETPVPVWLISGSITEGTQNVINYWKTANDVTENVLELAEGYQYTQKPFSPSIFTYDQKVGTVRVTEKQYQYVDRELTRKAYDFVNQFARSGTGSPYSNSLTRAASDDAFIHEVRTVDGYQREWYVYVPKNFADSEKPLPLVIYYHGSGQSGLLSMRQGDWWKLSEQKGFIVACPSGSLMANENAIPSMRWNTREIDTYADDCVFTEYLINEMAEKYGIDRSRVYVTGQSLGGAMSIMAGLVLPKMIAAVGSAGTSSIIPGAQFDKYPLPKKLDESCIVPVLAFLGEFDLKLDTFDLTDETSNSYQRCNYFCSRYGMDYNSYLTFTNGRNEHALWCDKDGVPLQVQVVVGLRAHSHRPAENSIAWNEWFCFYSRDPETGVLYYMNAPVNK